MISKGADVNARCVDHGSTPAQYLVQHEKLVRRLLSWGADPDIFMAAYWGDASLIESCQVSDPQCCNVRLGSGEWTPFGKGDIYKWKIGHDFTPVDAARSQGHVDATALILNISSPVAQLSEAVWLGDNTRAQAIIDADTESLANLLEDDPAALCRAAWENNIQAAALMLDFGFDPHQTAVHDSTPLDRAAFHGYADVAELLLSRDPNPPLQKRNEFGGTPLGACVFGMTHGWETGHAKNHVATAHLLIKAGSIVSEHMLGSGNSETEQLIKDHL